MGIKNTSFTPYAYNEHVFKEICELCSPLFQYSDINFFGYMRIFCDGKYFAISTNLEWQKYLLEEITLNGKEFQKHINAIEMDTTSNFLWPDFTNNLQDQTLLDLYSYNVWNGFSIYKKRPQYIESWSFAGDVQSTNLRNFYINNIQTLNRFVNYFNQKAKYFLNFTDANLLSRFENFGDYSSIENKKVNSKAENNQVELLKKLELDDLFLQFNNQEIFLSKREWKCLAYLSCGRSSKEISSFLGLSHRTVEYYINNIKLKTNVRYKSELLNLYENFQKTIL